MFLSIVMPEFHCCVSEHLRFTDILQQDQPILRDHVNWDCRWLGIFSIWPNLWNALPFYPILLLLLFEEVKKEYYYIVFYSLFVFYSTLYRTWTEYTAALWVYVGKSDSRTLAVLEVRLTTLMLFDTLDFDSRPKPYPVTLDS